MTSPRNRTPLEKTITRLQPFRIKGAAPPHRRGEEEIEKQGKAVKDFHREKRRERETMEQISVAPFVLKTYEMVSDSSTDALVTWGTANNSFVVLNLFDFSQQLLPRYFKHNNFSSFVRQLNTYGFRKVDSDRWEFANEHFLRGQRHLLKNIIRKRSFQNGGEISGRVNTSMASSSMEIVFASQVEGLKHERNSMVVDLEELKQSQMTIEEEVEEMNKRLQVTEKRPQQMMSLLGFLIRNIISETSIKRDRLSN